jgi:hypothetical protein
VAGQGDGFLRVHRADVHVNGYASGRAADHRFRDPHPFLRGKVVHLPGGAAGVKALHAPADQKIGQALKRR